MLVSHFPRFSDFSPYSRSYSVNFSFSTFFSVSPHISGPRVCILIFHVLQFFVFCFLLLLLLPFFTPTVCLFNFSCLSVFCPYSRSYIVQFSFSTIFRFSPHIPGPPVWVSGHIPDHKVFVPHFPRFSVFLLYPRSYSVYFSFSTFFSIFFSYSRS